MLSFTMADAATAPIQCFRIPRMLGWGDGSARGSQVDLQKPNLLALFGGPLGQKRRYEDMGVRRAGANESCRTEPPGLHEVLVIHQQGPRCDRHHRLNRHHESVLHQFPRGTLGNKYSPSCEDLTPRLIVVHPAPRLHVEKGLRRPRTAYAIRGKRRLGNLPEPGGVSGAFGCPALLPLHPMSRTVQTRFAVSTGRPSSVCHLVACALRSPRPTRPRDILLPA